MVVALRGAVSTTEQGRASSAASAGIGQGGVTTVSIIAEVAILVCTAEIAGLWSTRVAHRQTASKGTHAGSALASAMLAP